ncbi:ATP-binding protein [Streptomyces daliensis]|uniref:AAA family ATPase n=1 Tax=Streptomyces daliensis TaxID=299421 RepID=A0A8T4ISA8_9ACTN|nr:AAA family ATPase [Streptomyces daliensis]
MPQTTGHLRGVSRMLLERESELAAVNERLIRLSGGSGASAEPPAGGVLAFAGVAGAGKTTLLGEVRSRAAAQGCTVLRARGGEQEQESAFHVVRQLVQPVLAAEGEDEHRRILGSWYDIVAPAVGLVAPDGGMPDPQGVRDGLDWLVTRFAVRHEPVVMILDDAHWADAESLAWLTGFAPRAAELPMLIVFGYRPEDLPSGAVAFRRLVERDGSRPYELAPLTAHAVARVVRYRLGQEAEDPFCRECWAVTGGNPFEVAEVVARSYDNNVKPRLDNVPQLRELASAVKGSGHLERLERLGLSAVRLCWAVAVLGAEATGRLAAHVAGLGERETTEAAAKLREARILRPAYLEEDRIDFTHPLVATAVYRAIPVALRTALHGQAASAVVAAGMGPTAAARHLLEVHPDGDPEVVEGLREAARAYMRAGAPEAAHRCLARALREPPQAEERPVVLFELGCSALLTSPAATVNHLRAALEEPALDPALRELVSYRLAQALGHTDRLGEAARTVEAEARRAGDPRTRLRMQAEQFMWNAFRADEEDSPARSRKLARLASHLTGRGTAERYILGLRGWDAMVRGESAAVALRYAEEALGDGMSWTDEHWGFEVPVLVALTFMYADQPGRAEELFTRGIAECERKGWRGAHLSFGFTLLGYIRYRRGRLSEAEDLVRGGLRIADRVGSRIPAQWFAIGILIEILLARGHHEQAWELAQTYSYGQVTPNAVVYPDSRTVYAELLLARGLRAEAEEELTAAGRRLDPRGMRNPAWCPWQLRLAEAVCPDAPERAAGYADEALKRARRFGAPSAVGQALRTRALVATGAARLERLRESVRWLERSPAAYELAAALVCLGTELRRTGLAQEAADQLYRGLEGAVNCGALALAATARDELAAAGLPPLQLRDDDTDTLTTAERTVAERSVAGQSTARIAAGLGTGEEAVTRLLSGVYRKLGTDPAGLPRLLERRLRAVSEPVVPGH